jgi:CubicO group peptidase (beta-lactamase class C family)
MRGCEAADTAASLVRAAVADGVVPGAVLITGRGPDGPAHACCYGRTASGSEGREVNEDTVFDLASLTKVVATTPAVLRLVDQGALALDEPVTDWLPQFRGPGRAEVTARHLLTHTSGLPAHRDLWKLQGSAADRLEAALAEPLEHAPGSVMCYSDLGFITLGALVAKATPRSFTCARRREWFGRGVRFVAV